MVTHDGPESAIQRAMALLCDSPCLTEPPVVLPILEE
jgi:homoserine dehydrogenase